MRSYLTYRLASKNRVVVSRQNLNAQTPNGDITPILDGAHAFSLERIQTSNQTYCTTAGAGLVLGPGIIVGSIYGEPGVELFLGERRWQNVERYQCRQCLCRRAVRSTKVHCLQTIGRELLAGRAGESFRPGRHLRYAKETPMTNLYVAMLDRMGVAVEKLEDSTGRLGYLTGM